ncbi:unnamed protein product [Clavelina lepadiformis]|uniref:Rho-GAP domain-containing protein n=1 Tax=Clavelina lepadiformis TaxID=159417 RepID=A0ABP0H3W1_CLALP
MTLMTYQPFNLGLFKISPPAHQKTKLLEAFERNSEAYLDKASVTVNADVDGHTAANILKHFFRQLPEPLIPDKILQLSRELKCVSDENFAANIRTAMESWPAAHRTTLQYLLCFLQGVMRNVENRMTVTGLAVVFGPNVFKISGEIPETLENISVANQTFERLLLMSDIISDKLKDDQGYLNMTSPSSKPSRVAPPVPRQARPLPAPPVPKHAIDDIQVKTMLAPPSVPMRSKSLERSYESPVSYDDSSTTESCNADDQLSDDYNDLSSSDGSLSPNNQSIDETIRHVVRKRLFHADSSGSSCLDEGNDDSAMTLLPSLTVGRAKGPQNRRKPTKFGRTSKNDFNTILEFEEETTRPVPMPRKTVNVSTTFATVSTGSAIASSSIIDSSLSTSTSIPVSTVTASTTIVTTPDSGCLTAEEEVPQRIPQVEPEMPIFIPKLNLQDALSEDNLGDDTDRVPPLDLSEVTQHDEVVQPIVTPEKLQKMTPTKGKKKRKKGHKSSPSHTKDHQRVHSEPIVIPEPTVNIKVEEDVSTIDSSPNGSPSRWRDAWSTDEESQPASVTMVNGMHRDMRYIPDEDNIEVAPSSPNAHHSRHHHPHYHHRHHHHHHHHHHNNHMSRLKLSNNLNNDDESYDAIYVSLQEIVDSLDLNRKEHSRPEDLTLMTRDQIRIEKVAMQRELLKYESRHGRPTNKKEKEIMRGIYDRYRMVKRLMADTYSPPIHTSLRHHNDVEEDYDVTDKHFNEEEFLVTQTMTSSLPSSSNFKRFEIFEGHGDSNDHISAGLGVMELRKQQKQAKGERKRLRRKLRDFEREIEQQHGRSVIQADRVVMSTEYNDYRDLKAKLRLLDALIEKHNAQNRSL